jgi:hypothetical protein
MRFKMLTAIATLTLAGACAAQTMYRCGNSFSQTPCAPDAKPMGVAKTEKVMAMVDVPPADDVVAANKATCAGAATGRLKDPESARVGSVIRIGALMLPRDGKTQPVVLYQVGINAKNGFGGYAGESQWRCYFNSNESALISISEGGIFR